MDDSTTTQNPPAGTPAPAPASSAAPAAGSAAPATPSPIGSPNTSTEETLKIVGTIFATLAALAPLGDGIAVLAGADPADVQLGTQVAIQAIPGLDTLITNLIKAFGG